MSELPPPPPPPPSPSSLPTTRSRRFNMKMILGILIILIIVVALVVAILMNPGNLGGGGAKTVATQDDAYEVAVAVRYSATDAASSYSPQGTYPIVWNNQRANGAFNGYAIVNGNYEETRDNSGFWGRGTRTYNDVKIQFNDYQTQSFNPSITGDATLDGTVNYQEGASHTTYSGVWRLTGSVTLSGSFTGSVTFDIAIQDLNGWYGTITSDGQTWNVRYPV